MIAAVAIGLLTCVGTAPAQPSTGESDYWLKVKLPVTFAVGTVSSPDSCAIIAYYDFPKRAGFEQYSLTYWDDYFHAYTNKNYPPYPGMYSPVLAPPAGVVRQETSGVFGGGPCQADNSAYQWFNDRFTKKPAEAYGYRKRDGRFLLAGHVKDDMLQPVAGAKVRISGPSSKTVTTDADGYYDAMLEKGTYRVAVDETFRPVRSRDCRVLKAERACEVKLTQDRTADFEFDSPALVYSAKMSAYVRGNRVRQAVRAGYPFTVTVTLRNTLRDARLVVGPIAVDEADGNVADGAVRLDGRPRGQLQVTGAPGEVRASPLLVLEPKQTRTVDVVFTTSLESALLPGGLQAHVKFRPPVLGRVKDGVDKGAAQLTLADIEQLDSAKSVKVKPGSLDFRMGIDPSGVSLGDTKFDNGLAVAYFTMGVMEGAWTSTTGFASQVMAIPATAKSACLWTMGRVVYMRDLSMELWGAVRESPDVMADLGTATYLAWEQAYREVPLMLDRSVATPGAMQGALQAHFEKRYAAWNEGRWDESLQGWGQDTGQVAVEVFGPGAAAKAAKVMGLGNLVRLDRARQALEAQKLRIWATAEQRLLPYLRTGVAPNMIRQLMASVYTRPALGKPLTMAELRVLFGINEQMAAQLARLAKAGRGKVITIRARTEEALRMIERGLAVPKPFFVKAKTINYLDWKYLGYPRKLSGAVVMKAPEAWATVERRIARLPEGMRMAIRERWVQRRDEYQQLMDKYRAWAKEGRVPEGEDLTGFTENLVDPTLAPTTLGAPTQFRLTRQTYQGAQIDVIELSADGRNWKRVAGDSDLASVTHPNGQPLGDAERITTIRSLADGPIGAMHPDAGSWMADPKLRNRYIGNNGKDLLVQVTPTGEFRVVQHVPKMSRYQDPSNYYQHFQGGYWAASGGVVEVRAQRGAPSPALLAGAF